jgi:hypothetical protein
MWLQHTSYHPASYVAHHPSASLHHYHFNQVITLTVFIDAGYS